MYSHTTIIKSQNNKFPKNRDFYLLDKEDNIKYLNKTSFSDPDYICVSYEGNNNKICEKLLKKKYFEYKYDLIRVEVNNSNNYINFIIPKNVLNDGNSGERLLSEINKRRSLIKEIYGKTAIDINKKGNYLKEISFIPIEKRFYNKIFGLYYNTKSFTPKPNKQNRYSDNNFNNGLNSSDYFNKSNILNNIGNNIIFSQNNYEDPSQNMKKINVRDNNTQFNNNIIINNHINNQNNYNNQNQTNFRNNYNLNNNNGNNFNYFRNSYNFQKDNKNNPDYYSLSNFNNSNNNSKPIILQDKFNPSAIKNLYNNMKPIPEYSNPQAGINLNQTTPPSPPPPNPNTNIRYIFPKKGLRNIGSTCYMNATLKCLLHVNELIVYFIDEYPKDRKTLNDINRNVKSRGEISNAFYNLVKGVYDQDNSSNTKNELKAKTGFFHSIPNLFNSWSGYSFNNYYSDAFSPDEFKRTLGTYNPQFRRFEANDSKDLILYLLQTMHEELNYFGNKNQRLKYMPNQYNYYETYQHFTTNYNANNFSKISLLFYGTYINTTTCKKCGTILYNFPKFEFISFGMIKYHKNKFNILNGFEDNSKPSLLTGDNKYPCKVCNELQEAEIICKIFEPPNKLLINLDYGKNKIYQPSSIDFDEEIDITQFIAFDYKMKIRYRIIGVCTHYGYSGQSGHYVAFCKNKKDNRWYEFNDSSCHECNKNNIYGGSPYLLLYERIYN